MSDHQTIELEDCLRLRGVAQVIHRDPIGYFLKRVVNQRGIVAFYVVSAWIGRVCGQSMPDLLQVVKHLENQHAELVVVTRPSERENKQHTEAIRLLQSHRCVKLYLLPGVHAKIYLVTTTHGEFGMIGSPNISETASANYEVGLMIDSVLWGQNLIRELKNTIFQLRQKAVL